MPGMILVSCVAIAALAAKTIPLFSAVSPLIVAVVLGIAIRNLLGLPMSARCGIAACARIPLRLGVVLLGAQITIGQLIEIGVAPFLTLAASVVATYLFTVLAGRMLGVDAKLARLIGAGTAICGASAIVAANAVVRDKEARVAYALATVTLCGTLAMLFYPLIGTALSMGESAYGFWIGASVHEVAQVMAASDAHGEAAAVLSVVTKLARVLMLAPMLAFMGVLAARTEGVDRCSSPGPAFPWFIVGFLVMVLLSSAGSLPHAVTSAVGSLTTALLCFALGAIGLETCARQIAAIGFRPLLVALLASLFLAMTSLASAVLVFD